MRLQVRHRAGEGSAQFEVQRLEDEGEARSAPAATVEDPLTQALEGTGQTLGQELTWYLEHYLDYPHGPNQARAQRVLAALRGWGERAFTALFGHGIARDFYRDATRAGPGALHLQIVSDDAHVLAWPWEALRDPEGAGTDLAQQGRIERRIHGTPDPYDLPANLSRDRVHILLVTARPYDKDVAYRSISRPLVELIRNRDLPATVKLLRPPTFDQLRRELAAHPGHYHVVHFDGHGGFGGAAAGQSDGDRFKGPQGRLVFESADGRDEAIEAEQLSSLLREHRIPVAVLNACQSGMLADDAFASVATALLQAGVRSVVAMGYVLYVRGAQAFLPPFYETLFHSGSTAEAVRAGRQAMFRDPARSGSVTLQDWLVPVLYQQRPVSLNFAAQARPETTQDPHSEDALPDAALLNTEHAPTA